MATAPWPFLAILRSGDRVRGLGFTHAGVIVTLEHISASAETAELAGGGPQPVAPERTQGRLALMDLAQTEAPASAELGDDMGPVSLAAADDISGSINVLTGSAERRDDGILVTLEGTLGEDWTVAGSPLVSDGRVVGIAGPTATSTTVDAFTADAVRRVIAGRLSPTDAIRTLGPALTIAGATGAPAALLLAALRVGLDDPTGAVPGDLSRRVGIDRLGAAYERFAGDSSREPPSDVDDAALEAAGLKPLVDRAQQIRARAGDAYLDARHLLGATLAEPDDAFPTGLFDELGISLDELREALSAEPAFELAGGISADLVDPTTGIPLEKDHLGLGVDVTMFAALIADTKTPMPLSVGLFGEWGSGKSYFMGLLRAEIERLSKSTDPRYRSQVVQIGFNAWHYADSNLWASLGDEIFEQLAGPQSQTTEEVREALREDLDERLQRRVELKDAIGRAEEESTRLGAEVDKAGAQRGSSARALARAVIDAPTLRRQLEPALDRLGVTDRDEQIELLARELERAPGDAAEIRDVATGLPWPWVTGAVLLACAVLAVGAAASHEVAGVAAAVLTVVAAAGGILARVRSGARLLHEVADGVRRRQEADVADELAALRKAETAERQLRSQYEHVDEQIGELKRELAELTPGQRLYRFVAERAASDTYRGQLGLISTIRRDFEELRTLMKEEWPKQEDDKGRRAINRIVLYIDDLDRCSPEQVVEVLQAVHLLLAIDLFVVVVGVDPRWLLHSLRREYRSLLTTEPGEGGDARWESTPQDYLEKIFNIPFALPRMTGTSFGQLVESFEEKEAVPGPYVRGPDLVIPREEGEPAEVDVDQLESLVEEHSEVADLHAEAAPVERRGLTVVELEMLTALAPLVGTPREAKRLMNLYRMLRSTRDLSPAARFLGDEHTPGEYQAVVILLGLLSGHARLLHDVLVAPAAEPAKGGLRGRAKEDTWAAFADGLAPRDGAVNDVVGAIPATDVDEWRRLAEGLEEATKLVTLPDLAPFQAWAPRVARFSFLLSPYADGDE